MARNWFEDRWEHNPRDHHRGQLESLTARVPRLAAGYISSEFAAAPMDERFA
jgi:hypothetical protein